MMGFNPKNLTAFFVFVCILCGMTGWALIELLIWIGSHISAVLAQ